MILLFTRILRKLLWISVVFLGITLISFLVIHLAPGSPTDLQVDLNPEASLEARKKLNEIYGLDKPLHEQYFSWLRKLVTLDLGDSMSQDPRPVWDKIKERLPLTVGMNVVALFITLIIAIPIGVKSAARPGSFFDRTSTVIVFLGFAMPGFWLALLLMLLFGIYWPILPISGLTSLDFENMNFLGKTVDLAKHLILPVFISVFGALAGMSRYMRSSMLEVMLQDYILTARAKGLSERTVLFKHAFRNALLPVITLLGLSVPGLIGGSVILESIFSLPGLGQLFYQSVMARDYTLIMGSLVLGTFLTLLGNILADLAYTIADPRISLGGSNEKLHENK